MTHSGSDLTFCVSGVAGLRLPAAPPGEPRALWHSCSAPLAPHHVTCGGGEMLTFHSGAIQAWPGSASSAAALRVFESRLPSHSRGRPRRRGDAWARVPVVVFQIMSKSEPVDPPLNLQAVLVPPRNPPDSWSSPWWCRALLLCFSAWCCFPWGVAMEISPVFNMNCVILDSEARPVIQTCSRFQQRRRSESTFSSADCFWRTSGRHGRPTAGSLVSRGAEAEAGSRPPAVGHKGRTFSPVACGAPLLRVCGGVSPSEGFRTRQAEAP